MDAIQRSRFLAASEAVEKFCDEIPHILDALRPSGCPFRRARYLANELRQNLKIAEPILEFTVEINGSYTEPGSILAWGRHYENAHIAVFETSRAIMYFADPADEDSLVNMGANGKLSEDDKKQLDGLARQESKMNLSELQARIKRERAAVLKGSQPTKSKTPHTKKKNGGRPATAERDKDLANKRTEFDGTWEEFAGIHKMKESTIRSAVSRGRELIDGERRRNKPKRS